MEKDRKPSSNDDDDVTLFREAMRDVRPLTEVDRIIHPQFGPQPPFHSYDSVSPNSQDFLPGDSLPETVGDDEWSFTRPGLQRNILRRLRRGYWRIRDELDLHGLDRCEAHRMLLTFLSSSVLQGYRCVHVIHGRGLSSRNKKPILKALIGNWLVQYDDVLAFCQARPEHGGSGAVLVFLRNVDKKAVDLV